MASLKRTAGYKVIHQWLKSKGYKAFDFQEETWQHILDGNSGLVNAPTGCGKTFSVFLASLIQFINENPTSYQTKKKNHLQLLWVTPLRALAKDIGRAMEEVIYDLGMQWNVGIRNGDTDMGERQKQKRNMPEVLIITPESLHLLLAQKGYPEVFKSLRIIAVDEWHEILGSKRGVLVELALSRIAGERRKAEGEGYEVKGERSKVKGESKIQNTEDAESLKLKGERSKVKGESQRQRQNKVEAESSKQKAESKMQNTASKSLSIWGISATIGNLEQAKEVILASLKFNDNATTEAGSITPPLGGRGVIVKANLDKKILIESIIPEEIEKYPWAGHLGIRLAERVIPIIEQSNTTLLFINTRGMSERWYQRLLEVAPQLAGAIALHHGSIEHELRVWVEEALHTQKLKVVVCTASLDLGVDFRPVDTVIQVGSPKGVARFLQRAGRSGHKPGDVSRIFFLPTHSLELLEAAAIKQAIREELIETKEPMLLCFDVLIQYLCTLAISEGFRPEELFPEIKSTYCFADMTEAEWHNVLQYINNGGNALAQYDEYKKVEVEEGVYRIKNRRIAMRHRLHIGVIVSDAMMKVKLMNGRFVGVIEEWFISRLEPGDTFTLAGRNLDLIAIKDMHVITKPSTKTKSIVPSWMGGRIPLSSPLGQMLRKTLNDALSKKNNDPELAALQPLFKLQEKLSHIPKENELLIEQIETKDGFHLFVYPFEGRLVHEAMAALLAYRIGQITPITFSIAMNDYGFELLSDQPIPLDDSNAHELFTTDDLLADIQRSVNSAEMAKRKFRDISVIGGLVFQGYPGEHKKARHLQSSASLIFKVLYEYDPNNLLLKQAYQEVFDQQMEEVRLRNSLERIQNSNIVIKFPERLTPFCFPIKVDSLRETLSSEQLEDRVRKMQKQLEK